MIRISKMTTKKRAVWCAIAFLMIILSTSGCVHRYARVIATSTPPLARVSNTATGADYGEAPAYIDVRKKFFFLARKRARFSFTFEKSGSQSVAKPLIVTDWGSTISSGPEHVTAIHAMMQRCSSVGKAGYERTDGGAPCVDSLLSETHQ